MPTEEIQVRPRNDNLEETPEIQVRGINTTPLTGKKIKIVSVK